MKLLSLVFTPGASRRPPLSVILLWTWTAITLLVAVGVAIVAADLWEPATVAGPLLNVTVALAYLLVLRRRSIRKSPMPAASSPVQPDSVRISSTFSSSLVGLKGFVR